MSPPHQKRLFYMNSSTDTSGIHSSGSSSYKSCISDFEVESRDASLHRSLKQDMEGKIFHPVAVDDFIHHVWGLDRRTIQRIRENTTWPISPDKYPSDDYENASKLFKTLFHDLLSSTREHLGYTLPDSVYFWNNTTKDRRIADMNSFISTHNPGMITIPHPVDDPDWLMPWHIFDFDRHAHNNDHPLPDCSCSSTCQSNQLQLAVYARECMYPSTRHFVSGVFFRGTTFSSWYFDASCVIRTADIDFVHDPVSLAVVLHALATCDAKHAGFDPFMEIRDSRTEPGFSRIVGSRMVFPAPAGTSVPSRTYVIKKVLFKDYYFLGRGTKVYRVVSDSTDSDGEDEVLKLSWPSTSLVKEAVIIKRVVGALPGRTDHLPEVSFSATYDAEYLCLPRVELLKTVQSCGFEDRDLHVFTMKPYEKLWQVNSVEEFQDVFIDCVECHYQVFSTAGVLHGDLSDNNLMFKRKAGKVKGIVNDWDMASIIDDNGELLTKARIATGTLPFMARDLLKHTPPQNLYRHDLESFFYILVWAAIHYDFENKVQRETVEPLVDWEADLETCLESKRRFIGVPEITREVVGHVGEAFEGVREQWIEPLIHLFRNAEDGELERCEMTYDFATCGGQVTFHAFMEALGRTPRSL